MKKLAIPFVISILFLFACSDDKQEDSIDFKIGGIFSLTGDLTALGEDSKTAMELAISDANAVFAENSQDITVEGRIEDSALDPNTALAKITTLHSDDIEIVIGPSSSAEVLACKSFADNNNVMLISHYSTSGALAVDGDNIFRFCASDRSELPAVIALMGESSIDAVVPLWRNDAGNQGLRDALEELFPITGGVVLEGFRYEPGTTDFSAALASIKTQLIEASASYTTIAVYAASFSEIVQIFEQAYPDTVLKSVKWFGGDGIALLDTLAQSPLAAEFAAKVNCQSPNIARSLAAQTIWSPLEARIKAITGRDDVNPFALAVYDAVTVAINSKIATIDSDFSNLKNEFIRQSAAYFGASGWTVLNSAGDREIADYDFWAIRTSGSTFEWYKTASYNGATAVITH